MPKISALTTATPATGDLIPIVDVSDTTDDAAGSSRKCTVAALLPASGGNFLTVDVKTTGYVQAGSIRQAGTVASAGLIRVTNASQTLVATRNSADSGDHVLVATDGDALYLGTSTAFDKQVTAVKVYSAAGGAVGLGLGGTTGLYITSATVGVYQNQNLAIYSGGPSAPSAGGGVGVVAIRDAATAPSTDPTGGGVLYAEGGALKWRGSNGTVTTIAPA